MITQLDSDKLAESIDSGKAKVSGSGTCCIFYDLENGWGIKCYFSEYKRDEAWRNQRFFEIYDRAPITGDKVTVGDKYGYVTEVVETLTSGLNINNDAVNDERGVIYEEGEIYDSKTMRYILPMLLGRRYNDDHEGNYGVKNGRLVIIDCDASVNPNFNVAD
jgi:hypothetical protein